jgi:elongation factor Ts
MANVTAQMVKELRAQTDLPMMECKQALSECDGDIPAAIEWLRKKHKGKMADRAGRETGEGLIAVFIDEARKTGGIIELQCETAPVAKNALFVDLANAFARQVAGGSEAEPDLEALRRHPELDARFTEVYGKMRETMNLKKARRVTGEYLTHYVHHDGKSGVLIALDAVPSSDSVGADLCMHTTFAKPMAIDRSGIPAEEVEKIRGLAIEVAKAEGKPEQIIEKIAEGKVNAFYAEKALMEQLHARSDVYGKKKVAAVLKEAGVNAVTDVVLMQVGVG